MFVGNVVCFAEFLCLGGWEETVLYESLLRDSINGHRDPYGGVSSYGYNQWMPEEPTEYPVSSINHHIKMRSGQCLQEESSTYWHSC